MITRPDLFRADVAGFPIEFRVAAELHDLFITLTDRNSCDQRRRENQQERGLCCRSRDGQQKKIKTQRAELHVNDIPGHLGDIGAQARAAVGSVCSEQEAVAEQNSGYPAGAMKRVLRRTKISQGQNERGQHRAENYAANQKREDACAFDAKQICKDQEKKLSVAPWQRKEIWPAIHGSLINVVDKK